MQTPACAKCGGPNVHRDATAAWSPTYQAWVLADLQDGFYCRDCDDETGVIDLDELREVSRQ